MEEREEAAVDLGGDDVEGEGADGQRAELGRGEHALEAPEVTVDVEDATAEEIAEDQREGFPLRIIIESGFKHVLHVVGIGGDGVTEDMDVNGARWRLAEEVGEPVGEVFEIGPPRRRHVDLAHRTIAPPWPGS